MMINTLAGEPTVEGLHFIGQSFNIRAQEIRLLVTNSSHDVYAYISKNVRESLGKENITQLEVGIGVLKEIEANLKYADYAADKYTILLMEEALRWVLFHLNKEDLISLLQVSVYMQTVSVKPDVFQGFCNYTADYIKKKIEG
jgi:hypothetical protein